MKGFEHFLRFQLPAVAWALLIFILSSIPAAKLPELATDVNDKIAHASVYFIFGLLIYRALEPRHNPHRFSWMRLIISIGIVMIYGISDEIHQGFVPGRTEDILDATADTTGGFLSAVVMFIIEQRRIKRRLRD